VVTRGAPVFRGREGGRKINPQDRCRAARRWIVAGGASGHRRGTCRALEEAKTGLLQLEESNIPLCAPLILQCSCSSPAFFPRHQGVTGHPCPCTCQGTQVDDVAGDGAPLKEDAAGGNERGGGDRANNACRDHYREATAARGCGGGGRTDAGYVRSAPRARAGLRGEL
jgi:hypothetical protein